MTLASKINLSVSAALSSALDLVSPAARLSQRYSAELTDGTAAGMADKVFSDTRTIAASGSENLDLARLADRRARHLAHVRPGEGDHRARVGRQHE
jgi:hypothetical protein